MNVATDWKEVVPPGEAERLERYAEELRDLQRLNAKGRAPGRALHLKPHAAAEGTFEVLGGLPEHARVGIFAKAGTYRAWVRYSNGAGARRADKEPDQRGIAIKLLGVPGKKLIPGMEDAQTQDFLLIRTPATPFVDADDFVWFVKSVRSPATLLPRAVLRFGPIAAVKTIRRVLKEVSVKLASIGTIPYFSALPIRWGAGAAKYGLVPRASGDPNARPGDHPDHFSAELSKRLADGPLVYDFRVQFFIDEQKTPIEDASREWEAPWLNVGVLTLPKQDLSTDRMRRFAAHLDTLSFDPWHAPVEFRPLGAMMRARNAAYRLSTIERKAAPEPKGDEKFD